MEKLNNLDLRQARKQLGYTQAMLAEKIGVSVGSVARWEGNHTKPVPKYVEVALIGCRLLLTQEDRP